MYHLRCFWCWAIFSTHDTLSSILFVLADCGGSPDYSSKTHLQVWAQGFCVWICVFVCFKCAARTSSRALKKPKDSSNWAWKQTETPSHLISPPDQNWQHRFLRKIQKYSVSRRAKQIFVWVHEQESNLKQRRGQITWSLHPIQPIPPLTPYPSSAVSASTLVAHADHGRC